MAAFRFNFNGVENDIDDANVASNRGDIKLLEAKEITAPEFCENLAKHVDTLDINGTELLHMNVEHVDSIMRDSTDLFDASSSNSDLLPAVYEGGLKIWECTLDLVEYLDDMKIAFQDKRVLELGCGAGLPGIFALKHGASVDFQDYNSEVLEHFTIPNVLLNSMSQREKNLQDVVSKKCHFFAGDWELLTSFINPEKKQEQLYDIILTSETIYNVNNYQRLINFFKNHLAHPSGVVYVSAKTHYFGVGGGTRSFEEVIRKTNEFQISVCKELSVGLKREILLLKWS